MKHWVPYLCLICLGKNVFWLHVGGVWVKLVLHGLCWLESRKERAGGNFFLSAELENA